MSDTKIRVEYDWSDDSQLLDWISTNGSNLVRGNNIVTVTGGLVSVRSVVWKQLIKCSRIYAQDAKALNSSIAHLNIVTNVLGWTGSDFNPPEIIGLIYKANGNIWLENGSTSSLPAPAIVLNNKYTIDVNITGTDITAKSSSDNALYSYNLTAPPDKDRQVAVGGWGGDTEWGKLIIEGEITPPVQTPSDVINIQSVGAVFAPVIEVAGTAVIEWIFDDGSLSASATPVKDYGSVGSWHNYLKVTPWSALKGINVGYDALDGGYGGFAMVAKQNVTEFQNLSLVKSTLEYLCASYNPLTELDLSEFTALKFVELLNCANLSTFSLGTHPVLERLCVEACNLNALDLSGCPALEDLRAASNDYTSINWGSTGAVLWHICIRSNPQLTVTLPDLTKFPLLRELLTWDDNQTGAFICHSSVIQSIESYNNHYTSADISGCTSLRLFNLSGNPLASLDLGTADNLTNVLLMDCGLTGSQTDYVLNTLDEAGQSNGFLDISMNAAPSSAGLVCLDNLKAKGWTVTGITSVSGSTEPLDVILSGNVIKILLSNEFISWKADLYNIKGIPVLSKLVEDNTLEFDVSSLSPGIYIVVLSKGQERRVAKVFLKRK